MNEIFETTETTLEWTNHETSNRTSDRMLVERVKGFIPDHSLKCIDSCRRYFAPCFRLMKAFSKPFHLLLKGLWHLSSANFLTRIHFHTNNRGIEPNYFIQVLKFPANKSKNRRRLGACDYC